MGDNLACSIAFGKDLQEKDAVDAPVHEPRVNKEILAETGPEEPGFGVGVGLRRNDYVQSGGHGRKQLGFRDYYTPGRSLWIGGVKKWMSRAASGKCHNQEQSSAMALSLPGTKKAEEW
jgi:hypothetical protein